jgi:hypothetical protein
MGQKRLAKARKALAGASARPITPCIGCSAVPFAKVARPHPNALKASIFRDLVIQIGRSCLSVKLSAEVYEG